MSKHSNSMKELHLGMSYGKAQGILRKKIMFSLLQRLEEDICFKCKAKIETVEELSIEHKIPWLYADLNLYWDLDNIAFSHIKCNRPERRYTLATHGSYKQYREEKIMALSSSGKDI